MKKRLLSILLVALMVVSLMPMTAFAEATKPEGSDWLVDSGDNHVWYKLEEVPASSGTYTLTIGGSGEMPDWTLKDDAYKKAPWFGEYGIKHLVVQNGVTKIGNFAFYKFYDDTDGGLIDISLPSTLESIGSDAFYGCKGLANVTIPANVTSISNEAFAVCEGLESVTFAEGTKLESLGQNVFYECSKLGSVTIPANITRIDSGTFYNCTKLTSVTFGEGSKLESIGMGAFSGCVTLASVTIPANVKKIDQNAFLNCSNVKELNISSIENWLGITLGNVYANPFSLSSAQGKTVNVASGAAITTSLDISKTIPDYAFSGWSMLEHVTISSSVKSIGESAFSGCSGLTKVTIPSSVTSIGSSAFLGCSGLTSVTIPSSVTSIGMNAFNGCSGLTSVTIPDKVKSIGMFAFKDCTSLSALVLKSGTPPTIKDNSFNNSLLTTIYVPDGKTGEYSTKWSDLTGVTFKNAYMVNTVDTANGTVSFDKEYFPTETYKEANETVKVTVTPDEGYVLKSLKYNDGSDYDITSAKSFTMPHNNVTVTAEFVEKPIITVSTEADLRNAIANANIETTIKLNGDITLTAAIDIASGKSITLDLNGKVINASGGAFRAINIASGGSLTLDDEGATTEHAGYVDADGLWHLGVKSPLGENETAKTVTGGVITGGNASGNSSTLRNGGGINVSGTFTMNGGNIVGNTASRYGGGVCVNDGAFNMNGGSIVGNTASEYGGGVYVKDGAFTMYDGTVAGNAASQGGGVYADSTNVTLGGTVKIIENFRADNSADNFYVVGKTPIKPFSLGMGDNEPKAGMHVGIRMQRPSGGKFATNATDKTQVDYFTPDDSTFGVRFGKETEGVELGYLELAKLSAITTGGITNGTITTNATENKAFADDTVTITVTPASGYRLKADSLTVTKTGDAATTVDAEKQQDGTYTFPMPAYAVTVSAEFEKIPASSGGSSSSTITVPVSGDASTVKVSASVSGSTATVKPIKNVDLAKVTDGESVAIDLSGVGKNVDAAKIPTETVEKISEKSALTVKLPVATVEFDKTATAEIADQAKGSNIELVVDDVKEVSLNAVQKESVKKLDTALIIDAYLVSGGTKLCTEGNGGFNGGKAKVVLPYEIKNNRKPENYSVFYVDDAGKLQKLNAKYDKELAAFVFEIEHFSVYAVAYDENAMPFADVPAGKYYYDAVKWALENGITEGKKTTLFDPSGSVTRAQAVTFLWRAAGKPVVNYAMNMSDVASGKYYTEAVRWALAEGITKGTDAAHFSPNATCTRGQIVSFLYRYAKAAATETSNPFTDVKAGAYYYDAVLWAVENGITGGMTETTFAPTNICNRAQVVTFLYRWMAK